jgi:hypothetical protein
VERDSTIFSTNSDDDTVVFPATVMFPPTETFPLIPVPPATMRVPDPESVLITPRTFSVFPIKRSPDADAADDDCAGRWTAAVVSSGYIDNGRIQRSGHADPARNDECPVRHRRRVRGVCHPRDSSDVGASVHEQITAYSCSAVDDERPGSAALCYVSGCVQPSVKIDVPEV